MSKPKYCSLKPPNFVTINIPCHITTSHTHTHTHTHPHTHTHTTHYTDPNETDCFGGWFGNVLTKYILGYDMMIISSFKNLLPEKVGAYVHMHT